MLETARSQKSSNHVRRSDAGVPRGFKSLAADDEADVLALADDKSSLYSRGKPGRPRRGA